MRTQFALNSHFRTLAHSVGELSEVDSIPSLCQSAFHALQAFQPGSLICFEKFKLSGAEYEVTFSDHDSRSQKVDIFVELIAHHPYLTYLNEGGTELALKPTDLVSPKEWEANPLLNELYIPNKIPFGMFSRVFVPETSNNYNFRSSATVILAIWNRP